MPFKQFIIIPLVIAFQAFMMMLLTPYIPGNYMSGEGFFGGGLLNFAAFQAWATYFLAGFAPWNDQENGPCPKMGGKVLLGYLGGIIASIAIFELGLKVFGGLNGSTPWGLYLAVYIVVVGVISCERVPGFNFVPTWFIGAGMFFALMNYHPVIEGMEKFSFAWYGIVTAALMTACLVGCIFGYITVAFRVWYEGKVAKKE